ncbi:MAG: bifunctional DNA-formamidopyrimidine glycosylase/DNA-(apurinic or apyrimidinic site) lyase [Blastocatellia bacterium]|nr:bifunctional DNA-formamidopyrimidine glycosylase/DNA-(apurinic or apyrimidinic site) lyase [Blastocatellia bacterium]
MPELPEVAAVVAHLEKVITNVFISEASLLRPRLAPYSTAAEFSAALMDVRVSGVTRRGKFIMIGLSNAKTLLVHLRMSGRFMLLSNEADDPKFTHAVFRLADGRKLLFTDQRHFGLMKIVETNEAMEYREIKALAPEPFGSEFSVDYLRTKLQASGRSIKEFLLDQTKVCGLGNIYACEALFNARVNPTRAANQLTRPKLKRLHQEIRSVLQTAVDSMISRPMHPEIVGDGIYGESHSDLWSVYGREHEPCLKCNSVIKRIPQGGRSTYYCPRCQR